MRTIRQLLAGEDEIQLAVRLALLALLIYWAFVVIRPFVPILAWSVVLAVALYPVFNGLSGLLGNRPKLAATILTLINLGIVIGPATWLGLGAVEGLRDFAAGLDAGTLAVPSPPASVRDWPIVGAQFFALWEQASTNLRTALVEFAPHLKPFAGTMLGLAGDAGVGTVKFLVAVALTGFLFPAGPRLVTATRRFLSRVVAERSHDFLTLAGATIRSVAQGVIGIAVAQGLAIGIILKLADIPRAGLFAFAVMMLGILQIGSAVIVAPLLIWIWVTKPFAAALVITLCILPASLADNVLKPIVMGRGLTTPALIIFLGVIGGPLAHGIVGLFIGPIILAVAWELLTAWVRDDETKVVAVDADTAAKILIIQNSRKDPMTIQLLVGFIVSTLNIMMHALATVAAITIARAIAFRPWPYPRLHLMGVMVVTVAVLKFTHTLEIIVWALFYWLVGAAPSGTDLLYFAFVNYTTLGYGDILPVQDWRLLAPMAAMTGILMFGWSTAVIFDVLVKMLAHLGAVAAPGTPFSAEDRG